jgi:PDZ domain-containing protein
MSKRTLLALVAIATTAAPLAAQRTRVYDTRPGAAAELPRVNGFVRGGLMSSNRAIIGVTVDLRPSDNDSLGATVSAVTPGGPAFRAGILAGDIVTRVNGTSLVERGRRSAQDVDEEDDRSAPGLKMIELLARTTPEDTVTIEWRHERQRKTARIVTEAAGAMVFSTTPDGNRGDVRVYTYETPGPGGYKIELGDLGPARLERNFVEGMREGPLAVPGIQGDHVFLRFGGPFGGIQLAPLNADLGRYFGTTEGILVLETPDSSAHVDLKGGDVILSLGDRKPTSVEHLFRILGSYQDDETIRFDIMRDKRRMSVEAKAEDLRTSGRMRMLERSLMPSREPGMDVPVPSSPPRSVRPRAPRTGT